MQEYLIVKGQVDPIENDTMPANYQADNLKKLDRVSPATIWMHLSDLVYYTVQILLHDVQSLVSTIKYIQEEGNRNENLQDAAALQSIDERI